MDNYSCGFFLMAETQNEDWRSYFCTWLWTYELTQCEITFLESHKPRFFSLLLSLLQPTNDAGEVKWPVNNIFFVSYDLTLDLDIAMGGVLKGPRKGTRGQETLSHPGKRGMYNSEARRAGPRTRTHTLPAPPPTTTGPPTQPSGCLFEGLPLPGGNTQTDSALRSLDTDKTTHRVAGFVTFKPMDGIF